MAAYLYEGGLLLLCLVSCDFTDHLCLKHLYNRTRRPERTHLLLGSSKVSLLYRYDLHFVLTPDCHVANVGDTRFVPSFPVVCQAVLIQ